MPLISIWGMDICTTHLSGEELAYLRLLPQYRPTVEWIWEEMDRVWTDFKLDNCAPLSKQPIGEYYSHPVWIANGIFTARDPVSIGHRQSIAKHLSQRGVQKIADYGGGFGTLAIEIVNAIPNASVSIIEPYPSKVGLYRIAGKEGIRLLSELSHHEFESIVCQDVLEHVDDPIGLAFKIASSVSADGEVIFANCFYPVIQCHLPVNYYLRYTFPQVMKAMGLNYVGRIPGASQAQIFKRRGELSLGRARMAEKFARPIGSILNTSASAIRRGTNQLR